MRLFHAIVASSLVCLVAFPLSAAPGTLYAGAGGSGSAGFTVSGSIPSCTYTAAMRITKMRVTVAGNAVTAANLSATMTETNASCTQAPLGAAKERYRFRDGSFDGHTLRVAFASAQDNAAKHDVTYQGTLAGSTIAGVATFARYDCAPNCNWTVKVPQRLVSQP